MAICIGKDIRFSVDGVNVITHQKGDIIGNPSGELMFRIGEDYEEVDVDNNSRTEEIDPSLQNGVVPPLLG